MSDSAGAVSDVAGQTTVDEQTAQSVSTEAPSAPNFPLVEFESFSWSEEKYKVKIYIDMEDADKIAEESIRFVSFSVKYAVSSFLLVYLRVMCRFC